MRGACSLGEHYSITAPALAIAASAATPSPGFRLTAATALVGTTTSNSERRGVEDGLLDAVIGGQADDDAAFDGGIEQHRFQSGLFLEAAARVAGVESGVAVAAVEALLDDRAGVEPEFDVEASAPGVFDAVDGPDAAVFLEMGRVGAGASPG